MVDLGKGRSSRGYIGCKHRSVCRSAVSERARHSTTCSDAGRVSPSPAGGGAGRRWTEPPAPHLWLGPRPLVPGSGAVSAPASGHVIPLEHKAACRFSSLAETLITRRLMLESTKVEFIYKLGQQPASKYDRSPGPTPLTCQTYPFTFDSF